MSLYQLENHPNDKNHIVNPERNEDDEETPLNSRFQAKTQQNEKRHCDEPSEESSLNESHYLNTFNSTRYENKKYFAIFLFSTNSVFGFVSKQTFSKTDIQRLQ